MRDLWTRTYSHAEFWARSEGYRMTHNCSDGFHLVSQCLSLDVFRDISAICETPLWEGHCGKCKVIVMLASQSSHCAEWKKELCCHQLWGNELRQLRAAVHHQYHHPCLCCYWLCSFTSRRLRHVWFRWSDRCWGESHQQQTQDQRQRGKSFVSLYRSVCASKLFQLAQHMNWEQRC